MTEAAMTAESMATEAAFSLADYELADTATVELRNKRGDDALLGTDGKPVTVEVYSPGSREGVKALHVAGRAQQLRMGRTLRGEVDPKDAENADREQAAKLAAFTKGFSANFPVRPMDVFGNPKLCWISEQIAASISKYANF